MREENKAYYNEEKRKMIGYRNFINSGLKNSKAITWEFCKIFPIDSEP